MMTTYLWTIPTTESLTADGFITTAHWTASAVDGDFNASIYSTCSFAEGVATIPYDQVTQDEVLDWCWNGGVNKDATEAALAAQIELQKNPVTAAGVPWVA